MAPGAPPGLVRPTNTARPRCGAPSQANDLCGFLNVDLISALQGDCVINMDMERRFYVDMAVPTLVILVLFGLCQYYSCRGNTYKKLKMLGHVTTVTFLVFPTICNSVFSVFNCVTMSDGLYVPSTPCTVKCSTVLRRTALIHNL